MRVHPDPRFTRSNVTHALQINNVNEEDAGQYMCSVSTMDLPSITHTVRVLVPPSIAVFPNETRISVKSGERVEMSCNSKGIPTPTVSWKKHVSHSTKKEAEQNLELLLKVVSHSLFPSNVLTDNLRFPLRGNTRHTREHRERPKRMMEET